MRIAFGQRSVTVFRSEAEAIRGERDFGDILLGGDSDSTSNMYVLQLKREPHEIDTLTVVVLSEDHGVTPEFYADEKSDLLWIGYNSDLSILSPESRDVVHRRLDSVFYDIIPIVGRDRIIVVHETGLIAYDRSGEQMWKLSSDVVQAVRHAGNFLFLQSMEGDALKVSVERGEATRVPS